MIRKIIRLVQNNSSIFILATATVAFFLLNVTLKKIIDAADYGRVGLLLTYIALLSSFGLFGSEQLLIRQSEVSKKKKVIVTSVTIFLIITCMILQFIFPVFYHYKYEFNSMLLGVILSVSVTLNMLTYNIFRISGRYNLAQLNNGSWKIITLFIVIIFMSYRNLRSYNYIELIIVVIQSVLSTLFLLLSISKLSIRKITITKKQLSKEGGLLFFFFISLLTASFISQGDRLLVSEVTEDLAYIGEYLFLGTVIIFPYNFVQSYLGFKYTVDFKETTKPKELVILKLKEVSLICILYTPLVLSMLFVLIYLKIINLNFFHNHVFTVFMMFVIGIVRMYYSIFSSMMGTRCSLKTIRSSNIYFTISIMIGISIFFFHPSINYLLVTFTILWITRNIIWYYFIKKDLYE